MARRHRKLWLRLLAATLAASMGGVLIGGQAALAGSPDQPSTLNQFYQAVHLADAPAAYVVLVDTSGSMMTDGMYDKVRQYMASFERSLSPEDTVTYFTFSSAVSGPYPRARSLPPVASGDYTDFGPAFAQALSTLSAAADSGVSVGGLFLMSDGIIDAPPTDQAYLTLRSPGWSSLRKSATALASRMAVTGYGLTMPTGTGTGNPARACGGQATTDPATCAGVQEVLTAVFGPDVLVASGTTGADIGSLISRAKADQRRSKAISQLLANDVARGVRASIRPSGASLGQGHLHGSSVPVTIRLSSQVPDLPVTITGVTVRSTGDALFDLSGLPRVIGLDPGQTKVLPARLSWQVPGGGGLFGNSGEVSGVMTIDGTMTSQWLAVIRNDLAGSFRLGEVNSGAIRYSVPYSKGINVTIWLAIGMAVVILAALTLTILLIVFPRLATDIEVLDLRDDSVQSLRVQGRRRWKGQLDGTSGTLGTLSVAGRRRGGVRIRLRRELDDTRRYGRRRFTRNEIVVVASVGFRCQPAEYQSDGVRGQDP